LGSVAHAVLRTAPCSVEIVRQRPAPSQHGMKVLLASDRSKCSAKAVSEVANRPWPSKSQIRVLSAVQLFTPVTPSSASTLTCPYPTSLLEQMWNDARKHGAKAVADAAKTLTAAGLKVHEETRDGDPRGLILDEAKAWGADLIVLGSHGRHGLDRLFLGSVSESVAMYAHCSVEVVR
jgi:nucleotide-binding universal stress UspA family protein